MGVEYYLVDEEGRNVLDCHKWYAIDPADYDDVTDAEIEAAGAVYDRLPAVAIRWRREVCGGRKLRLATDGERYPWLDDAWERAPGWTLCTPWNQEYPPPTGWVKYAWSAVDAEEEGR
jgi:hypothetical protein